MEDLRRMVDLDGDRVGGYFMKTQEDLLATQRKYLEKNNSVITMISDL